MYPSTKSEFHECLRELEFSFAKLRPEIECTIFDRNHEVEGYVVVWNGFKKRSGGKELKFARGGVRVSPEVSLGEIRALARNNVLRNAIIGLPIGAAKSGMKADPCEPGFRRKFRRFVKSIGPILREHGYLPHEVGLENVTVYGAPYTVVQPTEFLSEEFRLGRAAVREGKAAFSSPRDMIAGLGIAVAADVLFQVFSRDIRDASIAIRGLHPVGSAVLHYLTEFGARIRYLSDTRLGGCFEIPVPLPLPLRHSILKQDFEEARKILAELRCRRIPANEIWFVAVDLIIPCLSEQALTGERASEVQAPFIVEGAGRALSESARTVLFEQGKTVVPDFISNLGEAISGFVDEMSRRQPNAVSRTRENLQRAKGLTVERVSNSVKQVMKLAVQLEVEVSQAGRFFALKEILGKQ